MTNAPEIWVSRPDDEAFYDRAKALAEELQARWWDECPTGTHNAVVLTWISDCLTAFDLEQPDFRGTRIDFAEILSRRRTGRDPLLRAVGSARTVLDVTAGYCEDSLALVAAGKQVTAFERNRVVHALAQDALSRFVPSGESTVELTTPAFQLHLADARDALSADSTSWRADAVYLDPMYPPKRKRSALPRKEIQLLKRLLGSQVEDSEALFVAATQVTADRWIVKRPVGAPALGSSLGWSPANAIQTKLVRFDIYTRRG